MSEHDTSSSVWSRYRHAKLHALEMETSEDETNSKPEPGRSLEELEKAIAELAASSGIPETGMPPRSLIHPSQYRKMTHWFYRILVVLFASLVGGLIWWGNKMYG
jgi:hypothetical protein